MKVFATSEGLARGDGDGLEILDVPYRDAGSLLVDGVDIADLEHAPIARRIKRDDAVLRAPVARPGKILCVGINYSDHVEEMKAVLENSTLSSPKEPVFVLAAGSAVADPGGAIVLPPLAPGQVDHGGELALVICKTARSVSRDEAWEHVAGLTLCNDLTARDVMAASLKSPAISLSHAKSFDTFKPMGPCLVTRDEFEQPLDLRVTTSVNGDQRQDAHTSRLIHDIPAILSHLSRYMSLLPGDVISTGSPSGVGATTGSFLRPGDTVSVETDAIGVLTSSVVAPS